MANIFQKVLLKPALWNTFVVVVVFSRTDSINPVLFPDHIFGSVYFNIPFFLVLFFDILCSYSSQALCIPEHRHRFTLRRFFLPFVEACGFFWAGNFP